MLKIAIVDDEQEARIRLRTVLNKIMINHQVDYQIYEFQGGVELLNEDLNEIDIVFLDIEMKNENGIEISKKMREIESKPVIIFVTSYDGYIRNAFGLNIYAYIMKDEIDTVVPRTLLSLLKEMNKKEYIVLHSDMGPLTIRYQDIMYVTIDDRKLYVKTREENIRIYGTSLKKLHADLNESFLYPNSKYIVNGRHIQSIENGAVIMEDNECIFISKGKFKKFNEEYKTFLMKEVLR